MTNPSLVRNLLILIKKVCHPRPKIKGGRKLKGVRYYMWRQWFETAVLLFDVDVLCAPQGMCEWTNDVVAPSYQWRLRFYWHGSSLKAWILDRVYSVSEWSCGHTLKQWNNLHQVGNIGGPQWCISFGAAEYKLFYYPRTPNLFFNLEFFGRDHLCLLNFFYFKKHWAEIRSNYKKVSTVQ